ncbi:AraC family transcriptional regulator, partial [Burkholderia contaminans]
MSLSLSAPPVDHSTALAGGDLPFGLQSVCRTLADANATLERFAWLGDHLAIAEWTRITDESETVYEQPGHHTLSCYLDGGYRTERQRVPRYGAPSLL